MVDMSSAIKSAERRCFRDRCLENWAAERRINLERLDEGQQWIVFVALRILAFIGVVKPLRRVLGYFLAHSGMELGSTIIGAVLDVSDRNIRYSQALSANEMWKGISQPVRGHRSAKLGPEQAGIVARYLVNHPKARVAESLTFLADELGVTRDRLTLRRYIKRYGLGCLRGESHDDAPLFWA